MTQSAAALERATLTRRAALASVTAALLLGGLKLYATMATGSVAMLGSLADTGLDLIASLVTLAGVSYAAQPADSEHRFGHGKAEAIAALLQTMLILISAGGIGWRAVDRLLNPVATSDAELGIGVSVLAILTTLALVGYQRHVVRKTKSIAIETDQLHYQSDLLLNSAVIVALALDSFAGLHIADPVFGLLIALYLAWGAVSSANHAIDMLMDREWSAERRKTLVAVITEHPAVDSVHDVRTRTSGHTDFIQFHIAVDPQMTVLRAHDIADEVEEKVAQAFPHAQILIHIDPIGHVDPVETSFGTEKPA